MVIHLVDLERKEVLLLVLEGHHDQAKMYLVFKNRRNHLDFMELLLSKMVPKDQRVRVHQDPERTVLE